MKLSELLMDINNPTILIKEAAALQSQSVQNIVDEEIAIFKEGASITVRNSFPDTSVIPIENPNHWLKVPDVIACFVDMEGSTRLSASSHEKTTANAYRLFTSTAIKIFHHFGANYIDVKGDGVFALFDKNRPYTALAATVTFKTFVDGEFTPRVEKQTDLSLGGHFGIDQKTVLVRKLGLKFYDGRTDRQNEVWAGKPVNMAAKLASVSSNNRLWVSDRFFNNITDDRARYTCGCGDADGVKTELWTEEDVSGDSRFDFDVAYSLGSNWCKTHGKSYCSQLVALDEA
ncbi:MAG: adenylate/guanylate cyclase domain-containing protein [Mesorhizobium sp.]|nr:MAG: adenylate/guanylate cyclase domain-containing protein [Mesorhizobium sp.]